MAALRYLGKCPNCQELKRPRKKKHRENNFLKALPKKTRTYQDKTEGCFASTKPAFALKIFDILAAVFHKWDEK